MFAHSYRKLSRIERATVSQRPAKKFSFEMAAET